VARVARVGHVEAICDAAIPVMGNWLGLAPVALIVLGDIWILGDRGDNKR
jgi:hypothetical protein